MQKTKIKLLLIILIISQINLYAQEYKNELRIGTYHYAFGSPQISYERYFNNNKSSIVVITELIYSKNTTFHKSGYKFGLQYRFYLLKDNSGKRQYNKWEAYVTSGIKFRDIYIVETKYKYSNVVATKYIYDIKTYGLEFLLGLKSIIHNRITIDISGGILIVHSNVVTNRSPHVYAKFFFDPVIQE